ncbi:hypothetical protein [Nevskia sp.]|uniref:hypothetical protein n=1 Tax=Nevskia sp. TaxID=1929292 RepID=UPI0025E2416F|nr:hypothetical protein [Nevskia sp.]
MKQLQTAARMFIVFGLGLIGLMVYSGWREKTSPPAKYVQVQEEHSIAERVVALDRNAWPSKGDVDVRRANYLLGAIAGRASTTELKVADMVAEARKAALESYGRRWTMLDLLEVANRTKKIEKPQDISVALAITIVADGH